MGFVPLNIVRGLSALGPWRGLAQQRSHGRSTCARVHTSPHKHEPTATVRHWLCQASFDHEFLSRTPLRPSHLDTVVAYPFNQLATEVATSEQSPPPPTYPPHSRGRPAGARAEHGSSGRAEDRPVEHGLFVLYSVETPHPIEHLGLRLADPCANAPVRQGKSQRRHQQEKY